MVSRMAKRGWQCVWTLAAAFLCVVAPVEGATIQVAAGGNLQQALDAAQPGDTILLAEGAEFVGNFVLPAKSGVQWITLRTSAPDSVLPPAGVRIQPAQAGVLARLRSPNTAAALRTAPGAHHWALRYLEFGANYNGQGDIIQIGDGSSAQNTLDKVPYEFVLSHLYVHGDPVNGQKRGIALNAAHVTIADSYVSECKGIGQDTQAIAGWNGPGPYTIVNNYLEGAGENVMFGGADPAIPDLVADGITFRRNYVSRPMSWRDPLVATPANVTAAAEGGGSLPAGVYAYRVVARRSIGATTARSAASVEAIVTTTATGAIRVRWDAVAGASEYRVYGRAAGAEGTYWRVTASEFVDTGASGTAEAVPTTAGTVWSVKNLFELKNARNVVIEDNVFENHWKESQAGYSIVLTPRNSNGACTWCVVEHVRFEYNLVRNVAAGVNILGYDSPTRPTRQTVDLAFRHNVFAGVTTALGGNAWFMLIGDEPRDISIEHNTVDANGTTLTYAYGGTSTDVREIYGLTMTANASRHGSYGINGQYFSYGNGILAGYYPGAIFSSNYLAGASASRYPAGTLVAGTFVDQFVDVTSGNFTLRSDSFLKGAAPDGTDIGASYTELVARIAGVQAGVSAGDPEPAPGPEPPAADFTVSCGYLACDFRDASTAGSAAVASWAWTFGDGAVGAGAQVAHAYAAAGSYAVTLTVLDANGLTSSTQKTIAVVAANTAPTAAFTVACTDLTCSFTDRSSDGDGRIVAWQWTFGAVGSAAVQSPVYTFPAPGTYTVTLSVTDDDGASAAATQSMQVIVPIHVAFSAVTRKWTHKNGRNEYWSVEATVAVHGPDERPIAGATVSAAWSGATSKTVSCVSDAAGSCVLGTGTLSGSRTSVTLTVTGVTVSLGTYDPLGNHDASGSATGSAVTFIKP
jgi:PKD repeat protein